MPISDRLEGLGGIAQLVAGNHCCALRTNNGDLFTWGNRNFGVGNAPTKITNMGAEAGDPVVYIGCSHSCAYALTESGKRYWWGNKTTTPSEMPPVPLHSTRKHTVLWLLLLLAA